MNASERNLLLVTAAALVVGTAGCGASLTGPGTGTGGSTGMGGVVGTGGIVGTGGELGTGGVSGPFGTGGGPAAYGIAETGRRRDPQRASRERDGLQPHPEPAAST